MRTKTIKLFTEKEMQSFFETEQSLILYARSSKPNALFEFWANKRKMHQERCYQQFIGELA